MRSCQGPSGTILGQVVPWGWGGVGVVCCQVTWVGYMEWRAGGLHGAVWVETTVDFTSPGMGRAGALILIRSGFSPRATHRISEHGCVVRIWRHVEFGIPGPLGCWGVVMD